MLLSSIRCFRCALTAAAAAVVLVAPGDAAAPSQTLSLPESVAGPVEVFALGFDEPSGIAVDARGVVLVTDRRAGTLTRIGPAGARETVLDNLQRPSGVAVDGTGRVFVVEDDARVLKLDAGGTVAVFATSGRRVNAVTAAPDGRIWMSVRAERGPGFDIVWLETTGALTTVVSGVRNVRAIGVDRAALYVAVRSPATSGGQGRTALLRMPLRADGGVGPAETLIRTTLRQPSAVAIDDAGDAFISGAAGASVEEGSGVILKRRAGSQVDMLAAGLRDPGALAFAPSGDLFVIEKHHPARVLRFRAPPPPDVGARPFTNQNPLRIDGRAEADADVRVFDAEQPMQLGATRAHSITGAFTLEMPLASNAETRLGFVATAAAGKGLVGPARMVQIVHDDHVPSVAIIQPAPGSHVRGGVVLQVRAEDEGSGVVSMHVMRDDALEATFESAAPGQPLVGTAVLDALSVLEGQHGITLTAIDQAGNTASVAQLLVVDRTPPETRIVTGPPEETTETTVRFVFTGADVLSANLEFAWRLDQGSWSAFSASPVADLGTVGPGAHRFDVKARDQAGNEDPTPAGQTFTVAALRIRILEPVPGAVIATETVWVRGLLEGGGSDVLVTVALPLEFRQELGFDMLPAATEAGSFAAELPVAPGLTTLSATARTSQGAVITDVVPIDVRTPLSAAVRLSAAPAAGLAPHMARFSTDGVPAGSLYSLDLEDDGTIEYEGETIADQEFIYPRPGIHVARLRVMTPSGEWLTARTAVHVYDPSVLEARLQAVWNGLRVALRAGDSAKAASFVHSTRRSAWEAYFRQFSPTLFAATDDVFTDVTLLGVEPGRAEGEMMRDVDGLLYSFPISFSIDVDGGWRLWQF